MDLRKVLTYREEKSEGRGVNIFKNQSTKGMQDCYRGTLMSYRLPKGKLALMGRYIAFAMKGLPP